MTQASEHPHFLPARWSHVTAYNLSSAVPQRFHQVGTFLGATHRGRGGQADERTPPMRRELHAPRGDPLSISGEGALSPLDTRDSWMPLWIPPYS